MPTGRVLPTVFLGIFRLGRVRCEARDVAAGCLVSGSSARRAGRPPFFGGKRVKFFGVTHDVTQRAKLYLMEG